MSRGLGKMQREIVRLARGAFTVREIAQKLYVKIDDSRLGGVRRAVRGLETIGYLIREPGRLGYYRLNENPPRKPEPVRAEWQRVPAPIRSGFQWQKRKAEAERDAEMTLGAMRPQDSGNIDYTIGEIGAAEAAQFIRRYEWLGTVGNPAARYCARDEFNEVAAVAILSAPVNVQAAGLCRPLDPRRLTDDDRAYLRTVVCLERGACAHWAHPHTASWFIPKVLSLARAEHGWKIFYAYSDAEAGEIGTIYQACNWLYIGAGAGRGSRGPHMKFRHRDWPCASVALGAGKWIGGRTFYERGLSVADVGRRNGVGRLSAARPWEMIDDLDKGKYVTFVGDKRERRELKASLRYPVLPYPKRVL